MTGGVWRYLGGALVASVSVAVVVVDAQAAGARGGRYAGRTSQGTPISFRVSGDQLTALRFAVKVVCPSRRVWIVTASVPEPVKVANSRFNQRLRSSKPGAPGTAVIKGQIRSGKVTGRLAMKRYIRREHHYCTGSATFRLRPRRRADGLRAQAAGTTMPVANERPPGRRNTSKLLRSRIPDLQR